MTKVSPMKNQLRLFSLHLMPFRPFCLFPGPCLADRKLVHSNVTKKSKFKMKGPPRPMSKQLCQPAHNVCMANGEVKRCAWVLFSDWTITSALIWTVLSYLESLRFMNGCTSLPVILCAIHKGLIFNYEDV